MWTFSNKLVPCLLILLQLLFGLMLQTAGLLSDYKTCGDQACARLMCRVQALKDYSARDCRFLSFKKGNMIDVYHKLSGQRNDLWAGSKDKDFGYFPRAAVRLDEVFVDEKKEVEMQTQETDFLCMDAFGTIIPSGENFEDYEFGAQTGGSEDLGNSDFDDRVSKSSEPNKNVEARHIDNNKDREELSRASWIRAAVSGWFANDAGDTKNKEENFESRKTSANMEHLGKKWIQTKALDRAEDKTNSALELKEEEKDNNEESTSELGNKKESVSNQNEKIHILRKEQEVGRPKKEALKVIITEDEKKHAGWYDNVFTTVANFYRDPSIRSESSKNEEKMKFSDNPDMQTVQSIYKDDKKSAEHQQKQEVSNQEDQCKNVKLGEEWYQSVYKRMTEFYGDTSEKNIADSDTGGGTSKSVDVDPSLTDKLETSEENMKKDKNARSYSSIYSRIDNVYGDPTKLRDVPDVMRDSQSLTQSESTKETLSFLMNSPSTVRDILTEPRNDKTKTSQSLRSKPDFLLDQSKEDDDSKTLELSDLRNPLPVFSINGFLMMINDPKSSSEPFTEEKEPDRGKERPSHEDDELNVILTEINVEEREKKKEEAVREVKVAEVQTHALEGSLDRHKQDSCGDVGKNCEIYPKRDHITGQSDLTGLLTQESEKPEKSEKPESWLEITENTTDIVDESEEIPNKDRGADMLLETEETEKRRDREQINHSDSNTKEHRVDDSQAEYREKNQSVNITSMKDDEARADVIETNLCKNKVIDVTSVESAGEIKDIDATSIESDGEKKKSKEFAGKNTKDEVNQVKNAGDGVNYNENQTGRQKGSVDVILREGEEEAGGDVTGEREDVSFTQKVSGVEKEDKDIIQKEQLSLHNAKAQNSHSLDPDKSRKSETHENFVLQWSTSTHTSGAYDSIANTSDGAQTQIHGNVKHEDKTMDVKHYKTKTSAQMQKYTYPNLQTLLTEKDIQVLLRFFSEETLTRLHFIITHSENIHSNELAEVHDFKQMLEHLLKTENEEIKLSLQSLHTVLAMLPKTFRPVIADGSVDKHQDLSHMDCVTEGCVSTTENTPISEQDMRIGYNMETSTNKDHSLSDHEKMRTLHTFQSGRKTDSHLGTETIIKESLKPEESRNGAPLSYTALVPEIIPGVFIYMVKMSLHNIGQVVMSLPDDIRPGPDLYGVPWEAVLFTATLGFFTFLLFTCRFFQAIKSRLYCSKERRMGQKVAELLEDKCKVLQTLSECEHKFKKLQAVLEKGELSAQASEKEGLEVLLKQQEEVNALMESDMEKMQEELETQDQLRKQQKEQIAKLAEMLKKLEQEALEHKSQLEQDKTTLKIHQMNTERLQKKLQQDKEENSMLQESKAQLEQEVEGWKERLSELEEERKMCKTSHSRMMDNCINKDENIKSLTECLLKMRDWDLEEDSVVNDASGSVENSSDFNQKQKVQKLINAAKMSADLKAVEEDKDRMFAKLSDEIKAKEDLQGGLNQLQHEKESLQSDSLFYNGEIEKLQHKLQIMSEMYQEKELKLHRMLTVEEKERSQKEEQLNKAGKKISLATDELNSYRQRAEELEEELEKTNQAYRNQIASHEKKAHDNWLAARAADRDLTDLKRENSALRQRLTDWQFKLELMEKNPQGGVLHFRGERSPFGPSPLGHPPSETRPFLSPPTLIDGPPRVSPQFPMMPSVRVPPGGVEGDRSISFSERGSPTWERERERRDLPPPGPDPGLLYRRPLSAPFLRAPLPSEAYFNDKSDSIGDGAGFNENGIRDNGRLMPGPDTRPGLPPPFPPVDPRDPRFPRRSYRPDFFPPPPLSMRGFPLPPGVFPRIPLPPHLAFPQTRSKSDVSAEPPSRPSPPGSEHSPEQPPSAHDFI